MVLKDRREELSRRSMDSSVTIAIGKTAKTVEKKRSANGLLAACASLCLSIWLIACLGALGAERKLHALSTFLLWVFREFSVVSHNFSSTQVP